MANPNTAKFPTNLPTDLDLLVAKNRALTKLATNIDDVALSFTVTDATKLNVPCIIQIDSEIIKVEMTTLSGNSITNCIRGFASTTATSHGINSDVKGYIFDWHHNQICAEIKAICAALGVSLGNVVKVSDYAGGEITGPFSNLAIKPNGVAGDIVDGWSEDHRTPSGIASYSSKVFYAGPGKNLTLEVDDTGRIIAISDVSAYPVFPVYYKAAIAQGTNAVLGFSFANTNAPAATIVAGTYQTYAVASFTADRTNDEWVQDHFTLPDDFVGPLSLDIYWKSVDVTNDVVWGVQVASLGNGDAMDVVWGTAATIIDTCAGSSDVINKATIATIPITNIVAGEEFFFKFFRKSSPVSGDDTSNDDAHLISLKFNVRRTFA